MKIHSYMNGRVESFNTHIPYINAMIDFTHRITVWNIGTVACGSLSPFTSRHEDITFYSHMNGRVESFETHIPYINAVVDFTFRITVWNIGTWALWRMGRFHHSLVS
eukprot:scaffold21461_cov38-Prasinocladus_malaysianus.AAC.1